MPRRGRAIVLVAACVVLSSCGGPVEVDVPQLSGDDREACAAFAADLPDDLAEQDRVEIEPTDAPAAAYGDPAIVVRCGVPVPKGFDLTASCEVANGVGYFIPDEQYADQELDLTLTAAGYQPRVEIHVPAQYRPNAAPAVMAKLAPLIQANFTLVDDCN